jgi:hypothetical protein
MKTNFNSLPKPLLIALGVGAAVIVMAVGVFVFASDEDETQIVLNNVGDCPKITLELVSEDGKERLSLEAKAGESDRINIKPNVVYSGRIISDNTSSGGAGCLFSDVAGQENIDQISRIIVPPGRVQEFNIDSMRDDDATATPNP